MSITAIPSSTFSQPQLRNAERVVQQNFAQIGQDLTSGNLSAARQDYAVLQQSLQSPAGRAVSRFLHLRHLRSVGPDENTLPGQILSQLGQGLASGNISAAQQAYSRLSALSPTAEQLGVQSAGVSFSG